MSMLTAISFLIGMYGAITLGILWAASNMIEDRDPPDHGGDD